MPTSEKVSNKQTGYTTRTKGVSVPKLSLKMYLIQIATQITVPGCTSESVKFRNTEITKNAL